MLICCSISLHSSLNFHVISLLVFMDRLMLHFLHGILIPTSYSLPLLHLPSPEFPSTIVDSAWTQGHIQHYPWEQKAIVDLQESH